MMRRESLGPVLIGLPGPKLDPRSREHLLHPAVGGVVLFRRNFTNREQLIELTHEISEISSPRPLLCVDQEGGRVQRFTDGFTKLPALGSLGRRYASDPQRARELAYFHARVMASEMLACGIDLSFAPVLDLDRGSRVIGDRAFASAADVVTELGGLYIQGMHDAGMKATGKHFPGHGSVAADSHTDEVCDERPLAELEQLDLLPFLRLLDRLDALMIAHVVYPGVAGVPAGYAPEWLRAYLRSRCGYPGVIISDDLGMHAAHVGGNLVERTQACLRAGCDLVLVCQPADVEELLPRLEAPLPDAGRVIASLYGDLGAPSREPMAGSPAWYAWQQGLAQLTTTD